MKRIVILAAAVFTVGLLPAQNTATRNRRAQAQAETQYISVTGDAAVPVTTVVPLQQAPIQVTDSTTVVENNIATPRDIRAKRRADRGDKFSSSLDSLVRSQSFVFYPASMQELPDGGSGYIFADHYYLAFDGYSAEIYLPVMNGVMESVRLLNFESEISDYRLMPFQSGLTTTFTLSDGRNLCFGRFVFSSVTGEAVLTLVTSESSMRYVGRISSELPHIS